jgi:hypothetical protein
MTLSIMALNLMTRFMMTITSLSTRLYDSEHSIQHYDTLNNDSQHNDTENFDTRYNDTQHHDT